MNGELFPEVGFQSTMIHLHFAQNLIENLSKRKFHCNTNGPLLIMDSDGNGVIISSYSNHLVQHSQTLESHGQLDIAFGGLGSFGRSKRQNFKTVITYGSDGANALIQSWGALFKQESKLRDLDVRKDSKTHDFLEYRNGLFTPKMSQISESDDNPQIKL